MSTIYTKDMSTKELSSYLLKPLSIIVVGDLVLDEYLYGDVNRVALDRPIPILSSRSSELQLGGAANVLANLFSLSPTSRLTIIGAVGDDIAGRHIIRLLSSNGIDTANIQVLGDRPTTHKLRVIAQGGQFLIRIDHEQTNSISESTQDFFMKIIEDRINDLHGIIISDYNKGLLTPSFLQQIIEKAKAAAVPIIVDPKGTDALRYSGATILKPNLAELQSLTSMPATTDGMIDTAADELLKRTEAQAIVVTRGNAGAILYDTPRSRIIVPAVQIHEEVRDVNGAGDSFLAGFALAYFNKSALYQATLLGNIAAGIAVRKRETAVVKKKEFFEALHMISTCHFPSSSSERKIVSLEELVGSLKQLRTKEHNVVFTNGCFDLLHAGYVECLEVAKQLGGILVVGLNLDSSVARIKGTQRPIQEQNQRARILAALGCVDFVILFSDLTPQFLIKEIQPDILVKGSDYKGRRVVGCDNVESNGGRVELVPLMEGVSTTNLIQRVLTRYSSH